MIILVINCGSSSIKYQLLDMKSDDVFDVIAKGIAEKIGLPAGSAKDVCGSYDSQSGLLNILKYTVPEGPADYVNGQWGPQEDPYGGDVINSYNDGPTETGFIQGPFYEIETSSPGAALAPGGSLTHVQYTIHLTGPKEDLSAIAEKIFGVRLEKIVSVFK